MKKTLVVAAGLAVLSTSAFASKARMAALNQDSALGSYYIEDTRNVWRSAGAFSGNYVIVEHGTNVLDAAGDVQSATAEGGFFREGSMFNYGLYLNSTDTYGNVADLTTVDGLVGRADLFLASNSGMKWGVRLGYERLSADEGFDTDEDGTSDVAKNIDISGIDLSLNAELGGANVWLSFTPGTDRLMDLGSTAANQAAGLWEQESDMRIGLTYDYSDHTLFAEYASNGGENDSVDGVTDTTDTETTFRVGAGRTMSTDSGMFFYDISYVSVSNRGLEKDAALSRVPVTFGFEAQATSWLQWRVSIQQSLFGSVTQVNGTEKDDASFRTTTVGAGASLTWGNLQIDGTLVGLANKSAGALSSSTDDGTTTENGNRLGMNDLMANVSATYNF